MYRNVSWGAIGVGIGFEEGLALAAQVGFEGMDAPVDRALERGADEVKEQFAAHGLTIGPWGLPLRWQGSAEDWQADLEKLPARAAAAAALGADRCATWVPSWAEREFAANWQFHLDRFTPAARIFADHGIRLGLEFIGTPSLRVGKTYEFVYTCPAMVELCEAIGPNVGLLLDSWHWFTSGGNEADLAALNASQVVQVHVNDAPAGVELADQQDGQRLLPLASGVIDSATFMGHLRRMDYPGPLTVEPFYAPLRALPAAEAASQVKASLDLLFAL